MTDKMWRGLGAAFTAPIALWVGVGGVWKSVTGVWIGKSGAWQKEFPTAVPGPMVPDVATAGPGGMFYGSWPTFLSVAPFPVTLLCDMGSDKTLYSYTFGMFDTGMGSWILEGSATGVGGWVTLDTQPSWPGGPGPITFPLGTPVTYRYFRFTFNSSYPPGFAVTVTLTGI